jgi:hypothetical protein
MTKEKRILEVRASLAKWGYAHLDKRWTVTDRTASEQGWIVLRGQTILDTVMEKTPRNLLKLKAHQSGDWSALRP